MKDLLVSLGKRIRALRSEKRWSQETLAFECGLHRTYLGHVELGKKNISFNNLVTISATLGLTLSELLAGLEAGTGEATGPSQGKSAGQTKAKITASAKLPPDVNRLVTELRVQRVTMDRALASLEKLLGSSSGRQRTTQPRRSPSTKKR